MKILTVLVFVFTSVLFAQGTPADRPMGPRPLRGPVATDEVKAYLNLEQAQVDQLVQLRKDERDELKAVFGKITENRKALREALQSTSPDASTLGNLLIDMQKLRKQIRETNEDYHTKALAVLKEEQKSKLAELEAAAKLRPVIGQAHGLNLLLPPAQEARDEFMAGGEGAGFGPMGMGTRMRRFGAVGRARR
jgi:Spy/CpxP family protein refolding chaperone